jgi:hypothetical protein
MKFVEPSQGLGAALSRWKVFLRRAKISNLRSALETAVRAWGVALYTSDEDHPDAPEEPEAEDLDGSLSVVDAIVNQIISVDEFQGYAF